MLLGNCVLSGLTQIGKRFDCPIPQLKVFTLSSTFPRKKIPIFLYCTLSLSAFSLSLLLLAFSSSTCTSDVHYSYKSLILYTSVHTYTHAHVSCGEMKVWCTYTDLSKNVIKHTHTHIPRYRHIFCQFHYLSVFLKESSPKKIIEVTPNLLTKLLLALNECTEWGQVCLLFVFIFYFFF